MKKILLATLLGAFFLSLLGCPAFIASPADSHAVTLDKYEAKGGDEITIDAGEYKIFDEKINANCWVQSDGTSAAVEYNFLVKNASNGIPVAWYEDGKRGDLTFVKKISSSKAVFRLPQDAITGSIFFYFELEKEEMYGCEKEVYVDCENGYSDKKVVIIK